jgi:Anti-sigma factor NepR
MSSQPEKPIAQIDRMVQDRIGHQLRAMYSNLVRQPLPDRLVASLRAVEEAEEELQRLATEKVRRAA